MGGSASCLCYLSCRRVVLVMKENGELLRFKEDSRVKDVLAANPCHKVIRCCSDRAVLPDSFQLSCNQLYFLLPRGLVLSDETFESLLGLAASRYFKFSALNCKREDIRGGSSKPRESNSRTSCSKADPGNHSNRWKPDLQTIPEGNSPALMKMHE